MQAQRSLCQVKTSERFSLFCRSRRWMGWTWPSCGRSTCGSWISCCPPAAVVAGSGLLLVNVWMPWLQSLCSLWCTCGTVAMTLPVSRSVNFPHSKSFITFRLLWDCRGKSTEKVCKILPNIVTFWVSQSASSRNALPSTCLFVSYTAG